MRTPFALFHPPLDPSTSKESRNVILPRAVSTLVLRLSLMVLGLFVSMAVSSMPAASAAPIADIEVTREPTTMGPGDEWLQYTVNLRNVAVENPVVPGEVLRCPKGSWIFNPTTFSHQWLRDGASLGSSNGAATATYTVQAADQGHSLQCLIKAANAFGSSAVVTPPQVIPPTPSPAPPSPGNPYAFDARPTIGVVESTKLLCTPPSGWSGSPTWSFQWLRNGDPIPGAVEEKYTPENPGADADKLLQCQIFGTNAGGTTTHMSNVKDVGSPGNAAFTFYNNSFITATPEYATGPVTLEIEAPPGLETAFKPITASGGWQDLPSTCTRNAPTNSVPATLVCESPDPQKFRAPGQAFSQFGQLVVTIAVGADAPETLVTKFRASGWGTENPDSMQDEVNRPPALPFGLQAGVFETKVLDQFGVDHTQAGGHPTSASATFAFNTHFSSSNYIRPNGFVKVASTETPRGFVGNALAVPALCQTAEEVIFNLCAEESQVGGLLLYTILTGGTGERLFPESPSFNLPIYALEPEYGVPAQFGFAVGFVGASYTFTPELRAEDGYAISLTPAPIGKFPALLGASPTLCSFGARRKGFGPSGVIGVGWTEFDGCKSPTDPDANPIPLVTNPTRCAGPPPVTKEVVYSWENPDDIVSDTFASPQTTGCELVEFEPSVSLQPTNHRADSPTGINAEITMPTDGLESVTGIAQANLDTATVTLPKGMAINPATADGLGACTQAQVRMKSNAPATCPDSSKIGTIEIDTPLIRETLTGDIFVAKQYDNPSNSLMALYMVFSSKRDGVTIKVAGKVVPDPVTGQLTSVFTENPEAPFSRLALHFNSGNRAPLLNPPKCGTYAIHSEFSPWSAANPANPTPEEIVSQDSLYEVTEGPNGGPCPDGALRPKLSAGLQGATAGAKSPFVFSLSRDDGTQRFSGLDLTLPDGVTAYLKGIPYCPDSALNSIPAAEGTGVAQIGSPSCPAASQIGVSSAGAGAGPNPFYVHTGKVYLAGPYKGAPLSVAVVTPAVAGPFDLGNVVVRNPLYVDPRTARVTAKSDPIPTILHGLLLDVRDIRVTLDRPGFTAAPTSCEVKSIDAKVSGENGDVANVSNRFQVGGCERLGFKPRLSMRLFGGTKRGAHPKIRAILKPRPGDAAIASASVALPRSEFLENAHIKTICTRVQFAANQCPPGSIYGFAEATSPLLDNPVSGPVYLRSSDNELPDLVVALRGPDQQPIEVHVAARIDSVNGGIRSTFDVVPDQPVSSFTLTMQGGKKGLLVNSRDLCKGKPQRATAEFTAHNGKEISLRPKLQNACKGDSARKGKKRGKRRNAR